MSREDGGRRAAQKQARTASAFAAVCCPSVPLFRRGVAVAFVAARITVQKQRRAEQSSEEQQQPPSPLGAQSICDRGFRLRRWTRLLSH